MKYEDGPSVEVETTIDAEESVIWELVSDVTTPARFSTELQEVHRIDEHRFTGRNEHQAVGEWETTCTIIAADPHRTFSWVVGDPAFPSATWKFTMERVGGRTRLRQWMQMGPAPSGLTPAIRAMPDKEGRIIERRLEEHRRNMQAVVDGIKRLAEGD